MRPLFTVHAGEYVVGEFIEQKYRGLNVWIPSKDTGIDLLVTNAENTKTVSLQVKWSKNFRKLEAATDFDRRLVAGGLFTLSHRKIKESPADYWVFVVYSFDEPTQFVIIPPNKLLERLEAIHGTSEQYKFYPWVIEPQLPLDGRRKIALDGRGIGNRGDQQKLAEGSFKLGERDLSEFLDNWSALQRLQPNVG